MTSVFIPLPIFPDRQTFAFVAASAVCSAMFRITLSLTLSNKQQQLHLLSHLKHYQTAFPSHRIIYLSFAISIYYAGRALKTVSKYFHSQRPWSPYHIECPQLHGVKDSNIKPPRNTTEVPIVTEVESCTTSKLVNQDELHKIEVDTTTIEAVQTDPVSIPEGSGSRFV